MDTNTGRSEQGFGFLERFPWKRVAFWGIFVFVLYVLHDFFDVIFFTFLFSFLFGKVVSWLAARSGKEGSDGFRKGVVLGLYSLLLAAVGIGAYVAYPHVLMQGKELLRKVSGLTANLGDAEGGPGASPGASPASPTPSVPHVSPKPAATTSAAPHETKPPAELWTRERVTKLFRQILGDEGYIKFKKSGVAEPTLKATQNVLNKVMPGLSGRLTHFFQNLLRWMLHLFLALVFSLIILMDLPRLRASVASLEHSRIGDFYKEIAPSMSSFGAILGKSFQAQALIAIANTVLTTIGIFLLGLPHPFMLTAVVFVCSFIPVVGVMISTIPLALFAIQQGGGLQALYIVGWVVGVHFIEAYFLNPKIVGGFMHMHSLAVLVILVVAEHMVGMWGLLLGVPIAFFLYHHFIKGDDAEIAKMPIRPPRRARAPVAQPPV